MQCVIPELCAIRELLGGFRRSMFCFTDLLKSYLRCGSIVSCFPKKETKQDMLKSKNANHTQDQHFRGFVARERFLYSYKWINTNEKCEILKNNCEKRPMSARYILSRGFISKNFDSRNCKLYTNLAYMID